MPSRIEPPDYEEMMKVVKTISTLTMQVQLLDIQIKTREAEIVKEAVTDPKYYQNGKIPSMDFIKSTYKITDFGGELIPKRTLLAELEAQLEEANLTFQVMKQVISLFTTESFNSRSAAGI